MRFTQYNIVVYISKSIYSKAYNSYSGKCSWSMNAPNLVKTILLVYSMKEVWKVHRHILHYFCFVYNAGIIVNNTPLNIGANRINVQNIFIRHGYFDMKGLLKYVELRQLTKNLSRQWYEKGVKYGSMNVSKD